MINQNIENGIERFIKYIRRMSNLTDEQLEVLLGIKIAEDPIYYTSVGVDIKGHIQFIRNMALQSDDVIRKYLKDQAKVNKDPVWIELFEDAGKKKAIKEMSEAAKSIKGDPKLFARRVA